jgi:ABC-type multidrug transport system fused ATPase/permease subunit
MKMDKILVIENGEIREKGSHNELLLKKGEYAKLWDIQSGGFIGQFSSCNSAL